MFTPVLAKHTKRFSLVDAVSVRRGSHAEKLRTGLDHSSSGEPMPFAYKLESPNFVPCKARGSELLFIGCGATHYTNAIQETCNEPNSFNAYERSEFRGERIGIGLMGMIGFGVAASTGKRRRIALLRGLAF